jgi:hypothetical protein
MKFTIAFSIALGAMATVANALPAGVLDPTFIESARNRGNADTTADIGSRDITGSPISLSQSVGIAGRIKDSTDTWTFTALHDFEIWFTDLDLSAFGTADPLDDGNRAFDSSQTVPAREANKVKTATFILEDFLGNTISSQFTSSANGDSTFGKSLFGKIALADECNVPDPDPNCNRYTLTIDGRPGQPGNTSGGSTYDIAIAAVPLPGALPLLLGALGVVGFMKRRQTA